MPRKSPAKSPNGALVPQKHGGALRHGSPEQRVTRKEPSVITITLEAA